MPHPRLLQSRAPLHVSVSKHWFMPDFNGARTCLFTAAPTFAASSAAKLRRTDGQCRLCISGHRVLFAPSPLYPRKETLNRRCRMSAKGHLQTLASQQNGWLFDHVVGAPKQCWRSHSLNVGCRGCTQGYCFQTTWSYVSA